MTNRLNAMTRKTNFDPGEVSDQPVRYVRWSDAGGRRCRAVVTSSDGVPFLWIRQRVTASRDTRPYSPREECDATTAHHPAASTLGELPT